MAITLERQLHSSRMAGTRMLLAALLVLLAVWSAAQLVDRPFSDTINPVLPGSPPPATTVEVSFTPVPLPPVVEDDTSEFAGTGGASQHFYQ